LPSSLAWIALLRCNQAAKDFGQVVIAEKMDERRHWHIVAHSLVDFVTKSLRAKGYPFWE
jgi:hypothetical protein